MYIVFFYFIYVNIIYYYFFFSSRRRHTRSYGDWSSDVCSSDLTSFGYHDLVVDMRGLVIMRGLGWPVVYDATHSLQRPGGEETRGERQFAFPLMRAAVACGVDGLFFETHPDPAQALSDRGTQLPLAETEAFLDEALRVHEAAG